MANGNLNNGNKPIDKDHEADIRKYTLYIIDRNDGIIGRDLVMHLLGKFNNDPADYLRLVPALLSSEELVVEIEYIIPGRASQSLFLPKGTNVVGVK